MSKTSRTTEAGLTLENVALVLAQPKYPENIGAAARCAMNMGIPKLIIVRQDEPDREKMLKMATHKAAHLIEGLERHLTLKEALASFSWVVGTTARQGRRRQIEKTPREMAVELVPLLARNRVALLFGPESRGLTNEDLQYCQMRVTIPTADFSSLNLAQAIGILSYELFYQAEHGGRRPRPRPKLATAFEVDGMYDHIEQLLNRIGFLKAKDKSYWMGNIRRFLDRHELRAKETQLIRGVCRQFLWYEGQRHQDQDHS